MREMLVSVRRIRVALSKRWRGSLINRDESDNQPFRNRSELPKSRVIPAGAPIVLARWPELSAIQTRLMMTDRKVLVSGPVGAGKTTAIGSVSEGQIYTEAAWSEPTIGAKSATTVALDHGTVQLSDNVRAVLFGTPGQRRFEYMWEILAVGAEALVILIPNHRAEPLADLITFYERFRRLLPDTPIAVGVTNTDVCDRTTLSDYRRTLAMLEPGVAVPVTAIDARRSGDVAELVRMALRISSQPIVAAAS